jgi:hypothetical protein
MPNTRLRAQPVNTNMRVNERGGPPVGPSVGTSVGNEFGVAVMVNCPPEAEGTMSIGFKTETLPAKEKNKVSARKLRVLKRWGLIFCTVCMLPTDRNEYKVYFID